MHLLEPLKEENFGLYSMSALELALLRCNAAFQNVSQKLPCRKFQCFADLRCSYMRTPLAAISDKVDSARQQRLGVGGAQLNIS